MLAFFGRYSPLSNFNKCNIVVEGRHFNCVEQFAQCRKAETLGDEVTAQKICKTDDPADQKALARTIKAKVPKEKWTQVAKTEMKKALVAKFSNNINYKQYLLASQNKILAEASSDDRYWGIGFKLKDPKCKDKNIWPGQNALGELLMAIRSELS